MKTKRLLTGLLMACSISVGAQSLPSYSIDYVLNNGGMGSNWADMLDTWEPGDPYSTDPTYIDDNFFISRVRPRTRIQNQEMQVNTERSDERKMLWWCPVGESTKAWGPFPRYNFDADNFSMWQYLDYHGNWPNGWIRVPGVFNDVAHKNGVQTGCLIFFEGSSDPNLPKLTTKENGEFKYARKFVQMLKFYGIDGVGVNPEGGLGSSLASNFQDFFVKCHEIGKELDWPFQVIWYESQSNSGYVSWTDQLNDNNKDWFSKNGKNVTDAFFLNYNWNSTKLKTSQETATSLGRSTYDVYAGMDIEGRGLHNNAGTSGGWMLLKDYPFSIGLWGNHADNMIHKNANELGSSDLAIQNLYQTKLEMVFSGGHRNPASLPEISNAKRGFSLSDLETFHGIEAFINAKSTINQIPFITRFNLGNGQFFNKEGKTSFPNKWYNIGMQDFLPTWRWWITDNWDKGANVPANAININFSFDDAWYGGSCLKLHGATAKSDVRLFKTELAMADGCEMKITYKMISGGTDPKMSLCISKAGSEYIFSSHKLPNVSKNGEWYTATISMKDLGLSNSDKIACIGLELENTTADYEILLGELSVINTQTSMVPSPITITHAEVLGGQFNGNDVKVIWQCGDKNFDESKGVPVYNDDVNVWYFEIYTRASEQDQPTLCTATTSWAAYVVGAPSNIEDQSVQVGVCAVNPKGERSEIVWSEPMEREIIPLETVIIDKPVIKPNQEFTVSFYDVTHAASKFVLKNAATGEEVLTKDGVTSFTGQIEEEGFYDLEVGSNDPVIYRGFIQITPEETGGISDISDISVSKKEAEVNEEVTYSYEGTKRDGLVSRGLHLTDVESFTIPSNICSKVPFTISCWVKLDENVLSSTEGTAFYNQRTYTDNWPTSDWGDAWWDIMSDYSLNACLLSGSNVQNHDYSMTQGVWTHLAMVVDKNKLAVYFNGKKSAENTNYNHSFRGTGTCYFGGSAANRSGFMGSLDEIQFWDKALTESEVQEAMKGYDPLFGDMPEGLIGYWRFEDDAVNTETGEFYNEGSMSSVTGRVTTRKDNDDITSMSPQFTSGVPALTGIMEINTETKWNLPGANITLDNENAKATYTQAGTYDATVTLENVYGKVEKSVKDIILISDNSSIEENSNIKMNIYPNPFTESANLLFAEAGNYKISVYTTDGTLVNTTSYNVEAGDIKQLKVDGYGMFFVTISKDGKNLKSFKITKK